MCVCKGWGGGGRGGCSLKHPVFFFSPLSCLQQLPNGFSLMQNIVLNFLSHGNWRVSLSADLAVVAFSGSLCSFYLSSFRTLGLPSTSFAQLWYFIARPLMEPFGEAPIA